MANEKVSAMPLATLPLTGNELIPIVQNTNNVHTTAAAFSALVPTVSGNELYASLYPGVVDDGVTDCRNVINTLMQACAATPTTLVVDGPIRLSTLLDWTKPIILPNDLYLRFTASGRFVVDGTGVPTFLGQHWQRSTWINAQFEYISNYGDVANDLTANPFHAAVGNVNSITIKADLAARFGNTFNSGGAGLWTGQTNMSAIFRLSGDCRKINFNRGRCYSRDWACVFTTFLAQGASNIALSTPWTQQTGLWYVTFSNTQTIQMLLTNGSTATSSWSAVTSSVCAANATAINPSYFIPVFMSLDPQWLPNETGINDTGVTVVGPTTAVLPTDVNFSDFELDGYCMGWVGSGTNGGGTFKRITGKRYGDMQDSFGNNVGGNITNSPNWAAPPHIIYLKSPGSPFTAPNKFEYEQFDIQGIYLGNPVRRDVNSGNIVAMKLEPAGGTRVHGVRSLGPDGAFDLLSNGFAGGSVTGVYCEMSTYKQFWRLIPATATIGAADTTFTISAIAPYVSGWPNPTGAYTVVFSNGISRVITFTNGSAASGSFAALGATATASIVVALDSISVPSAANWAARFPSGSGMTNFDLDIDVVDKSVIPGGHPIQSDDGTGHTNIRVRSRESLPDYPPGAGYQPGYIFTGSGNKIDAEIIYANCQSATTFVGACWIRSSFQMSASNLRYTIYGWRQVVLNFTGALTAATSATLTSPFAPPTAAYRVQFSDGSERMVTLTQGNTTASWSGAVTAAATANCNLFLSSNLTAFRQRILVNNIPNLGNYIEVNDISGGVHAIVRASGYGTERWTQRQLVQSAAGASIASNISFISTHAMECAIFNPTTNFGTTGSLSAIQVGYTGTPSAFQTAEAIVTGTDTSSPAAAPILLAAAGNITTTRNVLLTATGGTFDATGAGLLVASAVRNFMSN